MPSYKSYCWSLGTTSFRRKELNKEIESQLKLLVEFWANSIDSNKVWNSQTQKKYYDFLHNKGFVCGNAPNKEKDAREKTSGLVDLGLTDKKRKITNAGIELLKIVDSHNYEDDNILGISKDNYVYLKQLLKLSANVDGLIVRPFIVVVETLCLFQKITYSEFLLLPLIVDENSKKYIFESIYKLRKGTAKLDDVIWSSLSIKSNYKEAEEIFLNSEISKEVIMEIGMNRDGGQNDIPYFDLYNAILQVRRQKTADNIINLLTATNGISQGCRSYWKKLLFGNTRQTVRSIRKNPNESLNLKAEIFSVNDCDFKKEFFKQLHVIKAKNLLDNYADLNKRILKTTNTILFVDETVKFDIIPNCFFSCMFNKLHEIMFSQCDILYENKAIEQINETFAVSQDSIVAKARELYGVNSSCIEDVRLYVEKQRYKRFDKLVEEKFGDDVLISLLTMFENRQDSEIQSIVTSNADIPTIFEYVIALVWYKISDRQGKVLEYMNLSLDADLLPITHAAGGHEDITYKYETTTNYPAHTLLIEATLANRTNQRRMEMEPVSRHLGDYMLQYPEEKAYCVFIATYLHVNVVADFRGRKLLPYYSIDGKASINGMEIIPCQTSELKTIIKRHISYAQLYKIFNQAYQSLEAPNVWYKDEIVNKLDE